MRRISRRELLTGAAAMVPLAGCGDHVSDAVPYNAMGERVGEVTADSAIVHTRLTAAATRNNRGYSVPVYTHSLTRPQRLEVKLPEGVEIADLEGACPGKAGRVCLHYGESEGLAGARTTEWVEVGPATDYTHQFELLDLAPDTVHYYAIETQTLEEGETRRGAVGRFRTAPAADAFGPVRFYVITGQDYSCRDRLDGNKAYDAMIRAGGDFLVSTGDNVYYDIDLPLVQSVDLARFHWHRIYSQPLVVKLFQQMPGYWMKDDHDAFQDDCWPGRMADRVAPMTYEELAPVFLEQMPMGDRTYRTVRWGKSLEIWFVEVRDFRSPNSDPDGPEKTIWGAEQKAWLKKTLLASDADFRVLMSPTCIVGPGGGEGRQFFELPEGGADSHGDGGYAHEGREFRHWARENGLRNLITVNGDRHWQYHSVDPETGLNEFGCGALTDLHSTEQAFDKEYHRFLRCEGGFLSVALVGSAAEPRLVFAFHDVNGRVLYEKGFDKQA